MHPLSADTEFFLWEKTNHFPVKTCSLMTLLGNKDCLVSLKQLTKNPQKSLITFLKIIIIIIVVVVVIVIIIIIITITIIIFIHLFLLFIYSSTFVVEIIFSSFFFFFVFFFSLFTYSHKCIEFHRNNNGINHLI